MMSEKANASYGPFRPGDDVRVKDNVLHWVVLEIQGQVAILESGQSGIRRRETLDRLSPWREGRYRG